MTAEEFVHAGEALFGKRWKAPLSRALDIDPVTIWRYATGQWPVPVVVELVSSDQFGVRFKKLRQ